MAAAMAAAKREAASHILFRTSNRVHVTIGQSMCKRPQDVLVQPQAASVQWSSQQRCSSSRRSVGIAAASLPEQQAQQVAGGADDEQQQQQEQPLRVAVGTPASGLARSLVRRLQQSGAAELWASSAANHFTAMQALAEAHALLQEQQASGLAAVAALSASDQPVADDQKRSLKKLTLGVSLTEPVDTSLWAPGRGNISTNRTQQIGQVLELMRQQLGEPGEDDLAVVVVETRGEQAMTRALKAALSLQAGQVRALLIQPWRGEVVDVVAEKRGEARTAGGLLLLMRWAPAQ